jgi:hypothetical protein
MTAQEDQRPFPKSLAVGVHVARMRDPAFDSAT